MDDVIAALLEEGGARLDAMTTREREESQARDKKEQDEMAKKSATFIENVWKPLLPVMLHPYITYAEQSWCAVRMSDGIDLHQFGFNATKNGIEPVPGDGRFQDPLVAIAIGYRNMLYQRTMEAERAMEYEEKKADELVQAKKREAHKARVRKLVNAANDELDMQNTQRAIAAALVALATMTWNDQ